jgi:hypothetical protein
VFDRLGAIAEQKKASEKPASRMPIKPVLNKCKYHTKGHTCTHIESGCKFFHDNFDCFVFYRDGYCKFENKCRYNHRPSPSLSIVVSDGGQRQLSVNTVELREADDDDYNITTAAESDFPRSDSRVISAFKHSRFKDRIKRTIDNGDVEERGETGQFGRAESDRSRSPTVTMSDAGDTDSQKAHHQHHHQHHSVTNRLSSSPLDSYASRRGRRSPELHSHSERSARDNYHARDHRINVDPTSPQFSNDSVASRSKPPPLLPSWAPNENIIFRESSRSSQQECVDEVSRTTRGSGRGTGGGDQPSHLHSHSHSNLHPSKSFDSNSTSNKRHNPTRDEGQTGWLCAAMEHELCSHDRLSILFYFIFHCYLLPKGHSCLTQFFSF